MFLRDILVLKEGAYDQMIKRNGPLCVLAGSNDTVLTGRSSQTVGEGQVGATHCKGSEADAKIECRRIGCEVDDPEYLCLMSKMNCVVVIRTDIFHVSCIRVAAYCLACNYTC